MGARSPSESVRTKFDPPAALPRKVSLAPELSSAASSQMAWAEGIGRLEVRLVTAGPPVPVETRLARELLGVARERHALALLLANAFVFID